MADSDADNDVYSAHSVADDAGDAGAALDRRLAALGLGDDGGDVPRADTPRPGAPDDDDDSDSDSDMPPGLIASLGEWRDPTPVQSVLRDQFTAFTTTTHRAEVQEAHATEAMVFCYHAVAASLAVVGGDATTVTLITACITHDLIVRRVLQLFCETYTDDYARLDLGSGGVVYVRRGLRYCRTSQFASEFYTEFIIEHGGGVRRLIVACDPRHVPVSVRCDLAVIDASAHADDAMVARAAEVSDRVFAVV